jgi:putative ABC transport system permease protein
MPVKLLKLIFKNLARNRLRTVLTGLGVFVLVIVHAVVTNVTANVRRRVEAQSSDSRLMVSERWTAPSRVPLRYVAEVAARPDVLDWTTWNLKLAALDNSTRFDRQALVIATRPENFRAMQTGTDNIRQEALAEFASRKDAALVGVSILRTMGWRVGQQVTMALQFTPPVPMTMTIVGELPPGDWASAIFVRQDAYVNATGGHNTVTLILLKVAGEKAAQSLAAQLTADYENRQPSLKVETESAGLTRLAARGNTVLQVVDGVVAILLINMVVIMSNSISISVRERRVEMAVLKVLGFQPRHIAGMVIGEAMLLGGLAGALGSSMVCLLSIATVTGALSTSVSNSLFLQFPVPWSSIGWGIALGASVGLAGSVLPALAARKVTVPDVFARIA